MNKKELITSTEEAIGVSLVNYKKTKEDIKKEKTDLINKLSDLENSIKKKKNNK